MLRRAYALHHFPSNSRSVCFSPTRGLVPPAQDQRCEVLRDVLLCIIKLRGSFFRRFHYKNFSLFLYSGYDFLDLLAVAHFVVRDHAEPVVQIQAAEERMRPTIRAQVAVASLADKRQRLFSNLTQPRQHRLFLGHQRLVKRYRRSPTHGAPFRQNDRKVRSFPDWNHFWRLTNESTRRADDRSFHHHQVSDDLACGPCSWLRAGPPVRARHAVCREHETPPGLVELCEDWTKIGHCDG